MFTLSQPWQPPPQALIGGNTTWSLPAGGSWCSGYGWLPPGSVTAQPLVIASSYPPVPARLVDKIKSGKYVDIKEMLSDNISLLRSLEALHPAMYAGLNIATTSKPHLRDVGDILTRAYCFMGYVSICTPDQATRDMLTYAWLLVREARKHGGVMVGRHMTWSSARMPL